MKRSVLFAAALASCAWSFSGCRGGEESAAPPPAATAARAAAAEFMPGIKAGDMVARVNGATVARSEVDQATDNMMLQFQGRIPPGQIEGIRPLLWRQALENQVNQKLLLQEADREKIAADDKAVDEQIEKLGKLSSPEQFRKQLAALKLTEADLRREIAMGLRMETLLERRMGKEKGEVSSKEIDDYYRANEKSFVMPEKVRASHILLKVTPGDSAAAKEKKRAELAAIRARIVKGEDFASIARDKSECPSGSGGGDLGFFPRGVMATPFEDAAFSMKPGELSPVVETEFGYHLIKLTDRQAAETMPLDKARDRIAAMLRRQKTARQVQEYLLTLRRPAKIEYAKGLPEIPGRGK